MSEERKEQIFLSACLALFTLAAGWYVFGFIPERDDKLLAIHECFVASGCQADGIPGRDELATECWQDCTVQMRNQWENHEKGVATK